jgi:hypothetical protein
VTQCNQCGANLPDGARFCLQCGTPVQEQPTNPKPQQELDFIQPAIAGGMFLGFLSSIPFINILCCLWVPLGGAMAAVMLSKQRPSDIKYGDGAFVGVLSGFVGAIVGTIAQIPIRIISARYLESSQQLEEWLKQLQVEGPMRDWMLRVASGEISAGVLLFTFISNLLMYALFAMIGGILALALLKKREQNTKSIGS